MPSISTKLTGIQKVKAKLAITEGALLQQALTSTNPSDLMKAQEILTIQNKPNEERKAYTIDPNDWQSFMGYREKPVALTYSVLSRMSYALPIIRAIINTRIDQITQFCEPQSDRYSTGFVIRKKKAFFSQENISDKPTKQEQLKMSQIAEMIMSCGQPGSWDTDDFDTFTRKVFNDSLSFDQLNFENVRNNKGGLFAFYAVDASTIRIADTFSDNIKLDTSRNNDVNGSYNAANWQQMNNRIQPLRTQKVRGYYPTYCQIYQNTVTNDFYPWEMCFGIRNPTTNIYSNGYGVSEIEVLMNTVTSMLWADEYNRKFFTQGSAPKGFITIKSGSGANSDKIAQFKQQWQAMMSGVTNSHKTPVLEGDVNWVDLQKTNREMEFAQWNEYLIKVACAVYRIDPAEVNFPLGGSADAKPMFEGNNEARLKHSKDKGLIPLLKFYERKLNKYVVSQIDPAYELVFVGLGEDDPKADIERDVMMLNSFMTVDEIRVKRGLKELGEENGGNVIENAVWMQNKQAAAMAAQQGGPQDENGNYPPTEDGEANPLDETEDPFGKALNQYWDTLKKS